MLQALSGSVEMGILDMSELACTIKSNNDRLANSKQIQHVRGLFLKTEKPEPPGQFMSKLVDTMQLSYKGDRPFRYSHRVVATFTVTLICLYQVAVSVFGYGTHCIVQLNNMIASHRSQNSSHFDIFSIISEENIDVLTASFYVSFLLTTLLTVVTIFQIMISYRKNMEALYRGDFSVIPSQAYRQSAITIMTDNLHYPGYQIAYLFWSYVIHIFVLFITCLILAYVIVLPILGKAPMCFLQPFLTLLSTTAIRLLIYMIQKVVSRKWLLQNYEVLNKRSDSMERVLSLQNREAYHNIAYFMFFYYIFIALIRCLMRIFKAVFLGVILFGRIDRSGLMNGFETWDTGYMAYVSFLQMELVHCHPVVVVFCDQLSNRSPANVQIPMHNANALPGNTRSRSTSRDPLVTSSSAERYGTTKDVNAVTVIPKYNRRIHNRWLKVYTLLKNPSLVVK
ncbi:stimulated by retinoic acid gene 6 protein-like [Pecten maximus]|uniref:stimulated by retinoic acid gene 6 protein-like n=1 Tax=Pecten maximus TaxID=6579 RepID=UPI00145830B3|nr:stimulated by retinoic acid gene 6 protein-like [Pecten maximus]